MNYRKYYTCSVTIVNGIGACWGGHVHPSVPPPSQPNNAWGSLRRSIPSNFQFPSVDVAGAWRLWWCGNQQLHLPPHRKLPARELPSKHQKTIFYRWKFLMNRLQEYYEPTGGIVDLNCTVEQADAIFLSHMNVWFHLSTILQKTSAGKECSDKSHYHISGND